MVIYGDADEQFRVLFEAAPNGMIVTDHDGVITFVNKQTEKLFGYSREELFGRSVDVLVRERFQGAQPSLRAQFARQPETRAMGAGRDLYGLRKNKSEFPVEIGLNPFRSGDRVLVIASVVDITERKRHEEHIRFIMDELSHRSKNLLSVVLAIAHQTVEQATSFGEFQSNFESRLMALARSHDLLAEQGWSGALIEALVFVQLKPFIDDPAARLDAAGPPIMLTPLAAQNIGLALHELAANAMIYGALSSPEGRIVIRWELDDRQMPNKFRLSWQEEGGPRVNPPNHQGFGHKVLSHIAQELPETSGGLMFAPEGFAWRFECAEHLVLRHYYRKTGSAMLFVLLVGRSSQRAYRACDDRVNGDEDNTASDR